MVTKQCQIVATIVAYAQLCFYRPRVREKTWLLYITQLCVGGEKTVLLYHNFRSTVYTIHSTSIVKLYILYKSYKYLSTVQHSSVYLLTSFRSSISIRNKQIIISKHLLIIRCQNMLNILVDYCLKLNH